MAAFQDGYEQTETHKPITDTANMISRLYIKNFRSIKELEMFPNKLTALIGPNSAGKTNILKAIDLILGEGWATKGKVERELFNNPNEPIEIEADFIRPVTYTDPNLGPLEATGIRLDMQITPDASCKVRLLTNKAERWVNDDFKKKCHFIYIPAQRDLTAQMRVTSWTLLGKIMKDIHHNYIESYGGDEDRLKADLREKIQPAKDFIEHDFSKDSVTFKKFTETFKEFCALNSTGLANKFEPELNIYNINWFYKTLQIQVTENGGQVFDADELGSGLQNLILLSIFQTYAKLVGGRVIFGVEEPEIYLYPQAQRSLYESFQTLSNQSQLFYTTHNPNFVNAERADEIEIIKKTDAAGTTTTEKDPAITPEFLRDTKYQIYTHFNPHRNEIFFAKKILLVEGPSDKILWETLARDKWNIDLNASGISIIDCSGKGGVIYFIGACKLLDLNYFGVWDSDGNEPSNLLADALANSRGLEIDPNLEKFLETKYKGVSFSSDSGKKIKQSHSWASTAKEWPVEFESVKAFLEKELV